MSIAELIAAGVQLTVTGMFVVFLLLGALVYAVSGMSRLARALAPKEPEPAPAPARIDRADPHLDAELVSVMTAAIHRYRLRHRR